MNGQEKSILEVVANDVKWIKESVDDLKEEFKCQKKDCDEQMESHDKRIRAVTTKVWWILGVLAAGGIGGGLGIGLS